MKDVNSAVPCNVMISRTYSNGTQTAIQAKPDKTSQAHFELIILEFKGDKITKTP